MNIIEVSCFVHSPVPWSLDESSSCPCRCLLCLLGRFLFPCGVSVLRPRAFVCACVGVCVCFGLHCVCFLRRSQVRRGVCVDVCVPSCVHIVNSRKKKKKRYKLFTHHVLVASVVLVVVLEIMADEGGEEQPEEEVESLVCVRLNVNDNDRVYVKSSWRKTSFGIVVLNNQSGEAWSCDGA